MERLEKMKKITINSNLKEIEETMEFILELVKPFDVVEEVVFDLKLIMSEILVNAMSHGNLDDPSKKIHITYRLENDRINMTVEDEGEGFDYDNVADPLLPENLSKSSGRGIFLIRHLAQYVSFNDRGNAITFEKFFVRRPDGVSSIRQPADLEGKKVLVVGLQKSGVDAAAFLHGCGAAVTVTDVKTASELASGLETLARVSPGAAIELGGHDKKTFVEQDIVVLSPGVPADSPYVRAALEAGVAVVSEIELASWFAAAPYVAVTGTNGKTTTTTLVHEILKDSGIFEKTFIGGNIGFPFIGFVREAGPRDVIVLEISSFQMEWAGRFAPRAGALLNLTEDHLNRHGTMERYLDTKMRIFGSQRPEDIAVLNADDEMVMSRSSSIASRLVTFTVGGDSSRDVFVADGFLCLKTAGGEVRRVIPAAEIGIIGKHNLSNAAAALALAHFAFGVSCECAARTLKRFRGVHHRLEFVASIDGVSYFNDSKATNEDSAIVALKSFSTPLLLIAGGSDKGANFKAFAGQVVKSPVKKVFVIGQVRQKIADALKAEGFHAVSMHDTLRDCVKAAAGEAKAGDTVLLSPACASLDMFRNYEHRGDDFVAAVRDIGEGRRN